MGKIRLFLIGLCVCLAGNNLMAQTTSGGAAAGSENSTSSLIVRSSPNSDYITLELAGGGKSVPFEIFGLDGNEVYEGKISGTQLIEVSTWPSGTYFVICGTQREKLLVHK